MRKPTMKMSWHGVKGNKWKAWDITVDDKKYHHQDKSSAMRQFNAAKRVYVKLKKQKKSK